MADFFNMGGYAGFVWPAYGVSAAALLGLGLYIAQRLHTARKRLQEVENRAAPKPGSEAPAASDGEAA